MGIIENQTDGHRPGLYEPSCPADPETSEICTDNPKYKNQNALKAAFDSLQTREKDILSYYISKGNGGLMSYSELWKEEYEEVAREKDRVLGKMILLMESSYLDSI
jgi:hypothetical protein